MSNSYLIKLKLFYLELYVYLRIDKLSTGVFRNLENLTRIELQNNQLRSIQLETLATSKTGKIKLIFYTADMF